MIQRQRIELQPAYLLHQFDYRDTSRIAEFLVRDHGRVAVVARGAKRGGRQRGLLQPFQPLLLSWSGRELGTLTGLEAAGSPVALAGEALLAGFYLNELCLKLLATHDPQPEVFLLYSAALAKLRDANDIAPPLRHFELGLLEAIGYGLNLTADVTTGEAVEPQAYYLFQPDSGPRRAEAGSANGERALVPGTSLLAIAAGRLEDVTVLRDAQRILRAAIDRLLNGRPLKSREVLRDIYSRRRRAGGD